MQLGLIYKIEVNEENKVITDTLTSPNCPVAESLHKFKENILKIEGIMMLIC